MVSQTNMPGLSAPAFFVSLLAAALAALPAQAQTAPAPQQAAPPPTAPQVQAAQTPGSGVPPIAAQPVPGELELAKLVWSTMVAIDQANRSGNYSVLRDNSATAFQVANDPARLGEIFAALRGSRIDLSNAMLVAPIYTAVPQKVSADVLAVKGVFPLRPMAIYFDLQYQWERGLWRLVGVSVDPRPVLQAPVAPAAPAPAQPARRN